MATASGAAAAALAVLAGVLAFGQRRRGAAAGARKSASVMLQPRGLLPLTSSPQVVVRASAKQVFDVQWCINGRELTASRFNRPAGNGLCGRFRRADVDLDGDRFELVEAEAHPGQFALHQLDSRGALKHQLTTYGRVRAISMNMLLYLGDGEYGTLILLDEESEYGEFMQLQILMLDPPAEIIKGMIGAGRGAAGAPAQHGKAPAAGPSFKREVSPCAGGGAVSTTAMLRISSEGVNCHRISSKVRFRMEVSQKLVKDLTLLTDMGKAELWWGESDFAEFLQVRVEIGKAYRAAARKLGVNFLDVSSVGARGAEAYQAMVQLFPELKDESRRGLGLGRKKQRATNRDAYIAAVLEEQSRQREAAMEAAEEGVEEEGQGLLCGAEEAIAKAAMAVSEKDREYAHHLAHTYYEQDRMEAWEPRTTPKAADSPVTKGVTRTRSEVSICSHDSSIEGPQQYQSEEIEVLHENEEEEARARLNSKGFGLSRDKLQEYGLSATGHALSRHQRLRTSPGSYDDGVSSAGESDAEF